MSIWLECIVFSSDELGFSIPADGLDFAFPLLVVRSNVGKEFSNLLVSSLVTEGSDIVSITMFESDTSSSLNWRILFMSTLESADNAPTCKASEVVEVMSADAEFSGEGTTFPTASS